VFALLLEGPSSLLFPLGVHLICFSSPQLHLSERLAPTRLPKIVSVKPNEPRANEQSATFESKKQKTIKVQILGKDNIK